MCDKASFEKIRDAIGELQRANAVQSEQIKTLFNITERQGRQMLTLNHTLVAAVVGVLIIAVLALCYGALGKDGFSAVTNAAPQLIQEADK